MTTFTEVTAEDRERARKFLDKHRNVPTLLAVEHVASLIADVRHETPQTLAARGYGKTSSALRAAYDAALNGEDAIIASAIGDVIVTPAASLRRRSTGYEPMLAADADARARCKAEWPAGTRLHITQGIKKGAVAILLGWHAENPWMMHVAIEYVLRTVRFDWAERHVEGSAPSSGG